MGAVKALTWVAERVCKCVPVSPSSDWACQLECEITSLESLQPAKVAVCPWHAACWKCGAAGMDLHREKLRVKGT